MKRYLGLVGLVFVGTAGWRIGDTLSADALSMAVGVLFGVLAGIPAVLLVMASARRHDAPAPRAHAHSDAPGSGHSMMGGYLPPQPPVIVVAGPPAMQPALPADAGMDWQAPHLPRRFKVVGEREQWVEDW